MNSEPDRLVSLRYSGFSRPWADTLVSGGRPAWRQDRSARGSSLDGFDTRRPAAGRFLPPRQRRLDRRRRRSRPTGRCTGRSCSSSKRARPISARSSRRLPGETLPPAPRPARSATCSPASWTKNAPNSLGLDPDQGRPRSRSTPFTTRRGSSGTMALTSARWHRRRSSAPSCGTDDKKSDRYIVNLTQGGIGLPDESYYREAKFKPIREKYVAHIEKMLHPRRNRQPEGGRRPRHGGRDRAGQPPLGPRQEPRPHPHATTRRTARSWRR